MTRPRGVIGGNGQAYWGFTLTCGDGGRSGRRRRTGARPARRSSSQEPALADGVLDQFGAAAEAELLEGPGLVHLDGLDAQLEVVGDLAIDVAEREQADDLG